MQLIKSDKKYSAIYCDRETEDGIKKTGSQSGSSNSLHVE